MSRKVEQLTEGDLISVEPTNKEEGKPLFYDQYTGGPKDALQGLKNLYEKREGEFKYDAEDARKTIQNNALKRVKIK